MHIPEENQIFEYHENEGFVSPTVMISSSKPTFNVSVFITEIFFNVFVFVYKMIDCAPLHRF